MNKSNNLVKPLITAANVAVILGAVAKHNNVILPDFPKTIESISLIDPPPISIGLAIFAIAIVFIIGYVYFSSISEEEEEKNIKEKK